MTLKSKRTVTGMAAGGVCCIAYAAYAFTQNTLAADDLQAWAVVMLIALGSSMAVQIAAQIVFHIAAAVGISVKEREQDGKAVEKMIETEMAEDERDKAIGLKSAYIGYICAGLSLVAALTALACGASAVAALHIILGGCFAGSLVEGVISVCLQERGLKND